MPKSYNGCLFLLPWWPHELSPCVSVLTMPEWGQRWSPPQCRGQIQSSTSSIGPTHTYTSREREQHWTMLFQINKYKYGILRWQRGLRQRPQLAAARYFGCMSIFLCPHFLSYLCCQLSDEGTKNVSPELQFDDQTYNTWHIRVCEICFHQPNNPMLISAVDSSLKKHCVKIAKCFPKDNIFEIHEYLILPYSDSCHLCVWECGEKFKLQTSDPPCYSNI